MPEYKFVFVLVLSLTFAALVFGAQSMGGPAEQESACTVVDPGTSVTYQGPEPVQLEYVGNVEYSYLWTATSDGSTIATGSDRNFTFVTPDPSEGMKTVYVSLLVTDGFGCINSHQECLSVYASLPCGINGADGVCEDNPSSTFSYAGDAAGLDSIKWKIDGKLLTAWTNSGTATIDFSSYSFGNHTLTVEVSKNYWDPTATVSSTCEHNVTYIESPSADFVLIT